MSAEVKVGDRFQDHDGVGVVLEVHVTGENPWDNTATVRWPKITTRQSFDYLLSTHCKRIPDAPTEQGPRVPQVGEVYGWTDEFMSKYSAARPNERYRVIAVAVEEGKVRFNDGEFACLSQMKDFRLISPTPTPPVEALPSDWCKGCGAGSDTLGYAHLDGCLRRPGAFPTKPAAPPVPEKRVTPKPTGDLWCYDCSNAVGWSLRRTSPPLRLCDPCYRKRESVVKPGPVAPRDIPTKPAPWRPGDSAVAAARGTAPCWRTRGGRW